VRRASGSVSRVCAAAALLWLASASCGSSALHAEDGYDLWLRYRPIETTWAARYRPLLRELVPPASAGDAARSELLRAIPAMLGSTPAIARAPTQDGAIVFGTPRTSAPIARLHLDLDGLGPEGYLLQSATVDGHRVSVIAANSDAGVIFGTFQFLRLLQTRQPIDRLMLRSSPRLQHRILDHWDNLDGTVERGYAGASIWDWHKLPDYLAPRYLDYARACASIGINGAVLTNVNADALALTPMYLEKAAALARVFRPYGLKVYLTARFSAPVEIGGLHTADPLDPAVRLWWQRKVDEIYRYIPDFGGLLVKASSEGQPGPQDYGRSHADGANMLATALAPHAGIVMWRAFVYSAHQNEDRTRQAYDEFVPLDGQFDPNVQLQVKNGPVDFQPREPGHPLFGAMPKTPLMLEVQITKEYLGFATHLVYLGPLFEEALHFDTHRNGAGPSIARAIDGMAGVSNIGARRNWTGSHFDQANWYVFGRLAWNPELSSRAIAEECSQSERRAADAERELVEWKKVKFMEGRLGDEFGALAISATKYGLFVELEEMFIEGLVPIDTLPGDRYTYHENVRKIVGQRTRREFSIGDRVRVALDRVDAAERKLQFSIVEPEPKRRAKPRARA